MRKEEKQVSVKVWDEVPGEVAYNGKGPALIGEDFQRDSYWKPVIKTKKGWEQMAKLRAAGTRWTPFVVWIPDRGCYRINFGGP